MEKKYKLTEETLEIDGIILHRIIALKDFYGVKKGDLGGFVEKESNLAHDYNCWIYNDAIARGNAMVYGNAIVYGNAEVYDDAKVYGNAEVYGDAEVYCDATVCGNAKIYGEATVCSNAKVCGEAMVYGEEKVKKKSDYIVFKNWWSSGIYFTWTRSNDMWSVGCFYGTGEELIKKAYKDSEEKGREYERIVRYVESIKSEIK